MKTLEHKDRLTDTGCTIVNNLIKTPIPCVSYVVETDLVYFNNVVIGQGGYIPGPDTGSTPDTGDTPDTGSTPDTGDTPDTGSTPDTGDTPDTGSTPDTGDTPDTGISEDTCLTFKALGTGDFNYSGRTISYSTDNGETWRTTSNNLYIPVNEGDTVMWKASGLSVIDSSHGIGKFRSTCYYEAYGNVMSLVNDGDFTVEVELKEVQFAALFSGATGLTSTENLILPKNLKKKCFLEMFRGCTSLLKAPKLPASTLEQECYRKMFAGCVSLTTAPELDADVLVNKCYQEMFSGCTSLNYVKCLATYVKASDCTSGWLKGVQREGVFYKAHIDGDDWDGGESGIPETWTVIEV